MIDRHESTATPPIVFRDAPAQLSTCLAALAGLASGLRSPDISGQFGDGGRYPSQKFPQQTWPNPV